MIVVTLNDNPDDVHGVMTDVKDADPTKEIMMNDVGDDVENRGHDHGELFPTRTLPTEMEVPAATVPATTNGMGLDEVTRATRAAAPAVILVLTKVVTRAAKIEQCDDVNGGYQDVGDGMNGENKENAGRDGHDDTVKSRDNELEHGTLKTWNFQVLRRHQEHRYPRGSIELTWR